MAWLDDRAWCHPKIVELDDRQFRVWAHSIAYSSGMSTKGRLTPAQQRTIGGGPAMRKKLVAAGVWDDPGDGTLDVLIHDWGEHNGKRDERKERDRDRKRAERAAASAGQSEGPSTGQSEGRSQGTSAGTARADSDSDSKTEGLNPVLVEEAPANGRTLEPIERLLEVITDGDDQTPNVIRRLAAKAHASEAELEAIRERVQDSDIRSRAKYAVGVLTKAASERRRAATRRGAAA